LADIAAPPAPTALLDRLPLPPFAACCPTVGGTVASGCPTPFCSLPSMSKKELENYGIEFINCYHYHLTFNCVKFELTDGSMLPTTSSANC
jgi:hypothetical protein